jgi:rare lipoprotein A
VILDHRLAWNLCAPAIVLLVAGCSSSPRFTTHEGVAGSTQPQAKYQLAGMATYYADEFHGRTTASGEVYDMHALTAAHRTLPFNTKLRVTNLANGKSVVVRVNDRGPFKDDRVIDLSYEAAKQIGLVTDGTAQVRLDVLELGDSSK